MGPTGQTRVAAQYGRLINGWRAVSFTVFAFVGHMPLAAQTPNTDVATLLDYSEVESVFAGLPNGIRASLETLGIQLDAEQAAILDRNLAPDALRLIMEEELAAQDSDNLLAAAADLVPTGAIGRIDSIAAANEPTTTLEEFAQQLQGNRPPEARIQLMAQIVAAVAAGDFYVLVGERIREAAHMIGRAISAEVPPFEPISEEEWTTQAEQNYFGALVAFLHRYQPVSDELLRAALTDWSSGAGAWYVEGYSLALAESILVVADTISVELQTR